MKKENGLTFIATIFLVLIIAFLAFGVVYFVRMQTEKEGLEDLKTYMLLVQARVKKISGDYILEEKKEIFVGTKLSDMKEDEIIKQFLEKNLFDIEEKNKFYYVLNQQNLNDLGLTQVVLEEGTYYIVEYTDSVVYYTKGFEYTDGNVYYEMNDIENLKTEELN